MRSQFLSFICMVSFNLLSFFVNSEETIGNPDALSGSLLSRPVNYNRVIVISIPKSGTFLLKKCIGLLKQTESSISFGYLKESSFLASDFIIPDLESIKKTIDKDSFFLWTHLMYDQKKFEVIQEKYPQIFFIYRDPRDHIISAYFFMKQLSVLFDHLKYWDWVNHMTMDQFISKMIVDGTQMEESPQAYHGIAELYDNYTPYLREANICKIRFEDLIGEKGNGSKSIQLVCMKSIADHLGVNMNENELLLISDSLFGRQNESKDSLSTFREGKIGVWREYFSEENKQLFKKHAGNLLILWGYEKDLNW